MTDNDNQSLLEEIEPGSEGVPEEFLLNESEMALASASEEPALATPGEAGAAAPEAPEPGESSNPEIALEQMLAAAGEEELPLDTSLEEFARQEVPTFQLQVRSIPAEGRAEFKKACEAQGVNVGDKTLELGAPVLSQLSEFQAIALAQAARKTGASARIRAIWPDDQASEEDLALGDLSGIPEPTLQLREGAPSVTLPTNAKEVVLSTPESLPGFSVLEARGIVIAHLSLSRRLFREEELQERLDKELRILPSRNAAPLPGSQLQLSFRQLFLELQKQALQLGANAVLGLKLDSFPETSHVDPQLEQMRLVAFGTAAVVEKA
jgi:uncharacterized protein YbjQ (UPF0145 family)